jgi:hypothetical protein
MSAFTNLFDVLRMIRTDPSTSHDPITRMFLCDGQFITANVSIIEDSGNALHTQPSHDEIVLIIGGEADFLVGDDIAAGAGEPALSAAEQVGSKGYVLATDLSAVCRGYHRNCR